MKPAPITMLTYLVLASAAPALGVHGSARAQDGGRQEGVSDEQNRKWAEYAAQLAAIEATAYELHLKDASGPQLVLADKPALKWSNSNEATVHGSVLVWTCEGRPQAIASIYKFFTTKTDFDAEFHSLAEEPLVLMKMGRIAWQPSEGIRFQPLTGRPIPFKSAAARLVQMREIARDFSAEVTVYSGARHNLRLLTQPLVRYGEREGPAKDGAIFAYARATDPDVLLVLEARPDGDEPKWHYALARMHGGALRAWYRDKEVWSAPALKAPYFQMYGAYTTFQNIPEPTLKDPPTDN